MFSTLAFGQSRLRRPDIFPVLENEAFPEFIPQAEFISAEENPVFLRPDKVQGAEIGIYCLNLNSKKSFRTFSTP